MRAAIYARRSTDDHQAESLDVQIAEARRYIARKGWTLDDAHVFVDDAVSRAEFQRRRALPALVNAAKTGAFDVAVMRDESRLGGDMLRTALVVEELRDADVAIWHYFTDEPVKLDGPTDKIVLAVRSFAAELEREKIVGRTRENHETKARRGLRVGGRCYGYDNVVRATGEKDWTINEREAAVVRRIFEAYAGGVGLHGIAKALNDDHVPAPRAGRRGTGSWSPSCVREVLLRERYAGVLVWGREGKAYKGGTRVRIARPEAACVRVQRSDLRIVPEDVWHVVRARFAENARAFGGASRQGKPPGYLLSGAAVARCGECGGPMHVGNTKAGKASVRAYLCAHHRDRGYSVCENNTRRPIDEVDAAFVACVRSKVLREQVVLRALREVRRRAAEHATVGAAELPALEKDARALRTEIDRLVAALATGAESPTIVQAIADREARLSKLRARVEAIRAAPSVVDLEVRRMEKEARARLDDFHTVLGANLAEARRFVESVLDEPLTFTPVETADGRRFRVEGKVAVGRLFLNPGDPNGN